LIIRKLLCLLFETLKKEPVMGNFINNLAAKLCLSMMVLALGNTFAQPTIYAGPDTTICSSGNLTLTATIIPQAPIAYAPDPYTTGTIVGGYTDDVHGPVIPIGFNFCFLGNTYNSLVISSNNYVTFNLANASAYSPWVTVPVPTTTPAEVLNSVLGPWQDINPGVGGTIRYQVYGTAPYRHISISWYQVPMFSCTGILYTSQIKLFETTGMIESHIQSRQFCAWNGGNAVHALHNAAGNWADAVPGRNNTPFTVNLEGYRWIPGGVNPTVNWYENGVLIGTGVSINVNPTQNTEYVVELASGNSCTGLTARDTMQVFISNPVLTTNHLNAGCQSGTGGSAWADVTGAALPVTWSWNTVPPSNADSVFNLVPGTYTVTLTDANGCIVQANETITQQGNLVTSIIGTIDVPCHGESTGNLQVEGTGAIAPYLYVLNGDTSLVGIFSNLPAGIHNVAVIDSGGCTAIQPVTINEPAQPLQLSIVNRQDALCYDQANGSYEIAATGGTPPLSYSNGVTTNASGLFPNLSPGNYLLSVTDAKGCYAFIADTIRQPNPLAIIITSSTNISCAGGIDGAATTAVTGGTQPYNYSWNSTPVQNGANAINLYADTFQVVVTDVNNCTAFATTIITEPQPLTVTAPADADICEGSGIELVAFAAGGTGNLNYSWDNGMQNDTIFVEPTSTATYTITVTDANNCLVTDDVNINVFSNPEVFFSASNQIGCETFCALFENLTQAPVNSAIVGTEWDFGNNQTAKVPNLEYCYLNPGVYDVTLTITTDKNCKRTLTKEKYITVHPKPTVAFTSSPEKVDIMKPEVTFNNQTAGAITYEWTFGDNSLSSDDFSPMHTYKDTGLFKVKLVALTDNGCMDSVSNYVFVDPFYTFYIPTAFTPNGDGVNDIFEIYGQYIGEYNITIFDRWGKQVFQDASYERIKWDARDVPDGVYVYAIRMKDTQGKLFKYNGQLTVIR
jgi:gliding motility-associated-like protein